jgi:hypothetical protein
MTNTLKYRAALAAMLFASSPVYASSCNHAIAHVQAQVDAAIEKSARSGAWKPESLAALRGYQPTPQSLAQTEGRRGQDLQLALDALDRARAAERAGYTSVCRRQVSQAKLILQQQP